MAISANAIWQKTGGSDNAGGGFDPSLTTNMFTDLACTVGDTGSPIITSASYTFVAGDIGHWIFISSTTNGWYAGWYKIVSVSAGAATLAASVTTTTYTVSDGRTFSYTIGQAQSYAPFQTGGAPQTYALNGQFYTNTTLGCNSNATRSGGTTATWSIDRSRIAGGAIFDSGTVGTSATTAFTVGAGALGSYTYGKQDVGNILNFVSGTGITASMYAITNATSTIYTLDRSAGTTGTGIAWSLGGSFATIGGFGLQIVKSNTFNSTQGQRVYLSGSETLGSATINIATGPFSVNSNQISLWWEGFSSTCGDRLPSAYISAGSQTSLTILTLSNNGGKYMAANNLVLDGNSGSGVNGILDSNTTHYVYDCLVVNCSGSSSTYGISSTGFVRNCYTFNCGHGFEGAPNHATNNIADGGNYGFYNGGGGFHRNIAVGSSSSGFDGVGLNGVFFTYNVAYNTGTGAHGFNGNNNAWTGFNCVAYKIGGYGFNNFAATINCAIGNTTSGSISGVPTFIDSFNIALTSDPYVGNHIGGGTDLVVNASNNTWVTTATNTTVGGGGSAAFTTADIGLKIFIYGGTGFTTGTYLIIGVDSGTGSAILNFSPAATSATGGKWRIADFRPNNVAGGGAALRGTGIGIIGQVDAVDIGAAQHQSSGGGIGGVIFVGTSVGRASRY